KSSILNRLMATEHIFSSASEPGASRGTPHALSGSVELTWLIKETCSVGLWKSVMQPYYKNATNEIVLLANLHGNAIEYFEQVEWLQQFTSCFLVFIMPNCEQEEWNQFTKIVCPEKLIYAMVDSKNGETDDLIIETQNLMKDEELQKICLMIKEALEYDSVKVNFENVTMGKTLKLAEGIDCVESQEVIDFVKKETCLGTKQMMQLQKRLINHNDSKEDGFELWNKNSQLQELIKRFGKVLHLELEIRKKAMAHLERDLYHISSEESSQARKEVMSLKDQLWRISRMTTKNSAHLQHIKGEIIKKLEKVD
ncbi:1769_t:CDS:1, partial [Ambispora leptoticha]